MKRFLAILMTAIMMMTMVPVASFAGTDATAVTDEKSLMQALDTGGDIRIDADIVLEDTVTVAAGKNVVLDLNGHTVSMLKTADMTANYEMLLNKGHLTIKDSKGEGVLVFEYTGKGAGVGKTALNTITNNPSAVLTVESGTIQNKTSVKDQTGYAIDSRTNGTGGDAVLNINGGNIKSAYNIGVRAFGNSTTCTNSVVITAGNFTGAVQLQDSNDKKNLIKMNISGGVFNPAVDGGYSVYLYGYGDASGADVIIENGEFNGPVYLTSDKTSKVFNAEVKGGTFNDVFWAYTWLNNEATPVKVVKGGTFKYEATEFCLDHGYKDGICPACGAAQTKEIATAEDLMTAVNYATGGEIFKLTADIDLGTESVVTDNLGFTLDGMGHKITGKAKKTFEIKNTGNSNIEIGFKNVTIDNAYTSMGGRCIDTRNDNIDLTLDGVVLNAKKTAANTQPLTLGGYDQDGIDVTVKNSTIDAMDSGYAIINFVKANIAVEKSALIGYTTLYSKQGSNGTVINVTDSDLKGINTHSSESNAFGTIVIEDAQDVTVNIKDSAVLAESRGDQPQFVVNYNNVESTSTPEGEVRFTGNTIVTVVSAGAVKELVNASSSEVVKDVQFGLGVTVKGVKVADKYLSDETVVNNGKVVCAEHSYNKGVCTVCGAVDYDYVIAEKEKENNALKEELDSAKDELEETQKDLEETKDALKDAQAALDNSNKELAETKEFLKEAEETLTATQKELTETKAELESTKNDLTSTQEELQDTQEELTEMQLEMAAMKKALLMTKAKVSSLKMTVSGTQVSVSWSKTANAKYYKYVLKKNGKTYKKGTTQNTSLKWTNVTRGCKYTIEVTPALEYESMEFAGIAVSKYVNVNLARASLTTAKSGSYRVIKAPDQNSTGFQIYIATNSKFTKNLKKISVKTSEKAMSKSLKTITYFKKGKNYIKVRSYTTYNGITKYGSWSTVKTITR